MNKHYEKDSDWISGAALLVLLVLGALGMLFLTFSAVAQTIPRPTRITPYDFQCQDASGNKISDHQREGIATVECYNNADGAFVQGGRYRINRATAPPVEPPVEPPPTAPANLSGTVTPNAANPGNSNVALAWDAVSGAASYSVERCVGPTCTNFAAIGGTTAASYVNSNLPGGLTYRYRVQVFTPSPGAYSAVYSVVTPAAPTLGSATVTWAHDAPATLAGYRILYGATADALVSTIQVPNPALTAYVVEGLPAGTWFFAVRAYNSGGAESVNSNVDSKVLP